MFRDGVCFGSIWIACRICALKPIFACAYAYVVCVKNEYQYINTYTIHKNTYRISRNTCVQMYCMYTNVQHVHIYAYKYKYMYTSIHI